MRLQDFTNMLPALTPSHLTRLLEKEFPLFANFASAAGPVLYRILLHHGTYPFKPSAETTETFNGHSLAIALALLTAEDKALSFEEYLHPNMTFIRCRDWNDRVRLLFQSLCDTNWVDFPRPGNRFQKDDEDLFAVVEVCLPQEIRKKWTPRHFPQAVAGFPSSHSRELSGRIKLEDIRGLLVLVLIPSTSAALAAQGSTTIKEADFEETLNKMLSCFSLEKGYVSWDRFRDIVKGQMVRASAQSHPM